MIQQSWYCVFHCGISLSLWFLCFVLIEIVRLMKQAPLKELFTWNFLKKTWSPVTDHVLNCLKGSWSYYLRKTYLSLYLSPLSEECIVIHLSLWAFPFSVKMTKCWVKVQTEPIRKRSIFGLLPSSHHDLMASLFLIASILTVHFLPLLLVNSFSCSRPLLKDSALEGCAGCGTEL